MIEEKFPEYAGRIAAGLVGEGSECLGYDDAWSTDHDFGPGFCLWLTKKDYRKIGQKLQEAYDALPKEFMGYASRNTTEQGKRRVGVFEIGTFFRNLTGYKKAPKEDKDWLPISQESLRTAVSGEIFDDPLGKFTKRRAAFSMEPESVRLKRLYVSLGKMAQAGQYNFPQKEKCSWSHVFFPVRVSLCVGGDCISSEQNLHAVLQMENERHGRIPTDSGDPGASGRTDGKRDDR